MTLHSLGCSDEAPQQLRKAVKEFEQPSDKTKIANSVWNRRLTIQLLRQEAEGLLKKRPQTEDPKRKKKPD
jgi:hypothetical protein